MWVYNDVIKITTCFNMNKDTTSYTVFKFNNYVNANVNAAHCYALDYFYIPENIKAMVMSYFHDFNMCLALQNVTSCWQRLERMFHLHLFVVAFEVILTRARQVVGGVRLPTD